MLLALKRQGAEAYFATQNEYLGDGLFSTAYTTDEKKSLSQFRKTDSITADIIYDKGGFTRTKNIATLNPAFVHAISASKAETYRHFSRYQPVSTICDTANQFTTALRNAAGDLVVIKTPTGNGGHGVRIAKKDELLHFTPASYPIIVQEFMDTSVGIDGLVQGYHDLRLKVGDGEIWSGTLRTPAPGEYRANVAQGDTERHLFPDEIPDDAKKLALEIDSFFAGHPRYYAIDLAHTTKGWKLIELNSKPGLSPVHLSAQSQAITNQLAAYLIRLTKAN